MNLYLNCKRFEENLVSTNIFFNGIQYLYRFDNDYGASVVKHSGSYGHEEDLWEMAVIKFNSDGNNYAIRYDTGITDDVIGYMESTEVEAVLEEIKDLK